MKKRNTLLAIGLSLWALNVQAADRCEALFATKTPSQFEMKEVMDVSRTEKALVFTSQPKSKEDIINAIAYAKKTGLKVTIKRTNHSHGGHNRRSANPHGQPQAVQLDMLGYNRILHLDKKNLEVTVESGVTWKDLSGSSPKSH